MLGLANLELVAVFYFSLPVVQTVAFLVSTKNALSHFGVCRTHTLHTAACKIAEVTKVTTCDYY